MERYGKEATEAVFEIDVAFGLCALYVDGTAGEGLHAGAEEERHLT